VIVRGIWTVVGTVKVTYAVLAIGVTPSGRPRRWWYTGWGISSVSGDSG
jgi:hypothetical protein